MSIALRALGAALVGFSLIFGFSPTTVQGVSCGTVFTGPSAEAEFTSVGPDCADKRSSRAPLVWATGIAGIVMNIAGFKSKEKKPSTKVPWN